MAALAKAITIIPSDEDWAVLMDYDTMFLYHPEEIVKKAIEQYPDTAMFTCFTNRIGNKEQLLEGKLNGDPNILHHFDISTRMHNAFLWKSTDIIKPVSGFCMILKKSIWKKIQFSEAKSALGIDNDFSVRLLKAGHKIRRIDGLYMFHYYRLNKGVKWKKQNQVTRKVAQFKLM